MKHLTIFGVLLKLVCADFNIFTACELNCECGISENVKTGTVWWKELPIGSAATSDQVTDGEFASGFPLS